MRPVAPLPGDWIASADRKKRKQSGPPVDTPVHLPGGGSPKKELIRLIRIVSEFVCKMSGSKTQVVGFFRGSWRV